MPRIEDVAHYSSTRAPRSRVRVTPEELGKGRGYNFPVVVRQLPQEVSETTEEAQRAQQQLDVDAFSETVANLFRCDYPGCPRAFETKRALSYHKSQSHLAGAEQKSTITIPGYRPPETNILDDGRLQCSACNYVTSDEKSMSSHKRAHYTAARAQYVHQLEIAAAEVGGLRRALRAAQSQLDSDEANIVEPIPDDTPNINVSGMVQESPLTIERAMDFILEQVSIGDDRILELERENRSLRELSDSLQEDDQGEAIATIELIKEAFRKFNKSDLTMVGFLTEVENALVLIDPSINDDDEQ